MADLDVIQDIAQRNLVIPLESGQKDVYLWEHAKRITRAAHRIAIIENLTQAIDPIALSVAGWFCEAGWVVESASQSLARNQIKSRVTSAVQRELAASLLVSELSGILEQQALDYAARCVRSLSERPVESIEARIIMDADSLEECGPICLWQMVRQHAFEGRALDEVLEAWEMRKKYGYWNAIINDSIHFESVKAIARSRLDAVDRYVAQIRDNIEGADIVAYARDHADAFDHTNTPR